MQIFSKCHLVVLLAMAIILSSCSQPAEQTSEARKQSTRYGGVYTTNQFEKFSTLFPPHTFESSTSRVGAHIMETLITYEGREQRVAPLLAKKWEVNPAADRYIFEIRDDVFFHDDKCFEGSKGRKLVPEDVLFCLRRICMDTDENKCSWLFLNRVKGVDEYFANSKVDPDAPIEGLYLDDKGRLVIELIQPNVEFIHALADYGTSIYPAEMLAKYGKEIDYRLVGTGAFKPKVMRPGQLVILERNPNYWGTSADGDQLPYLDGAKITFESTTDMLSKAMNEGTIHSVINGDMQEGGQEFQRAVSLRSTDYRSDSQLDYEVVFCGFLNDRGTFKDVRIRQAFNLAINREEITDNVLKGSAYPGIYGIVPPAFSDFPTTKVPGYELDVERARQLLAEAGYPGGKGFPAITLQTQNKYRDAIVAQNIQQQLMDQLGVTISISALPKANHFERIEKKEAEFWLDNWVADFLVPGNFLALFDSDNTPEATGSFLNIYGYKNQNFDKLMDSAAIEHDTEKRMALYGLADSTMISDAAILPVYYEKTQLVTRSDLRNIGSAVMGRVNLRSAYFEK